MDRAWKPVLLVVIALVALSCAPTETETETTDVATEPAPTEEVQDATIADPDRYKVEEENEHFRIVRITYGPGEESVMHSHPDHVAVFLTDLQAEFEGPDGTTEPVSAAAGTHLFIPAGSHHPRSTAEQPFEGVAIELKAASAAAAADEAGGDPVEVDAEHYSVEFENDQVRVLRIVYGPGEESTMHYHREHAAVALNAQTWDLELADGSTQEIHLEAGGALLAPAGDHLPRNAGDESAEVVVVELK
jgi:quercetin dioxygenase-like cupin family protein